MQDTLIAHTNSKEIRVANSDDVMSLLKESVDETKVVASNQIDLEDSIEEISNEVEDSEEIIEDVEESTEEVLVEEEEEEVSFNL